MSRRRSSRDQKSALYQELLALYLQKMCLLGIQSAQDVCISSCLWKQRAAVEKFAREQPEREQLRLRRCIEANRKMTKRVKDLVDKQIFRLTLLAATQRSMRSLPEPEDPCAFRRMTANLDYRQSQLPMLLKQQSISVAQLDSSERLETWMHADGAGLDTKVIIVQPFSVKSIIAARKQYIKKHLQYHVGSRNRDDVRSIRFPFW